MLKLCSKCKKRPAVIFISDPNAGGAPQGLCLSCAKELNIKPVDDMLQKMNISDEDIDQINEQFMDIMSMDNFDGESFETGGAPAFPNFLNNIFGGAPLSSESAETVNEENDKDKPKKADKKKKHRYLSQFCTNLTQKARNGELDAIIGRDKELYRTIQILVRRTKNNPCLIGEPGVGKTAIAEGLAIKIASGDAPARLLDKEIYLLDITGLVAGTQFRGQFESRVKGLIDEIKAEGNIIVFIDEVHNLVGAGDSTEGSMNAANILKPALSRGEIQMIGATTFKEYRKYIEKDAALERRFQPVTINEPSIEEAIDVITGIKSYYEGYHNVTVPDNLIRTIVTLSERYVTDRFLPDKAIDLLDEACAGASLENTSVDELYKINSSIAKLNREIDAIESEVENTDYQALAERKTELERCQKRASELYTPAANTTVTEDNVAAVIEMWTGIPASKIKQDDLNKLANIESHIKSRIIGQDEAAELVVAAVKRSRVKTGKHRKPASFIFVGPTGVGKTELVKVLADRLFDSPETLMRLDMSEFMEKHSVSRIIGAPPGYVGYDEAGQLTEKVRRKPYSVILFDEIEKAHPDVMNVLLQILDDGRITDAQGRTVNFENTIIVMTSNAGSELAGSSVGFGKTDEEATRDKTIKSLREFLRPEFLGRVDEIVVFKPLDKNSLSKIAEIMLNDFAESLNDRRLTLNFDTAVCDYIAEKCIGAKSGAREVRNTIRREIEDKVVDLLIDDSNSSISEITVKYEKEISVFAK